MHLPVGGRRSGSSTPDGAIQHQRSDALGASSAARNRQESAWTSASTAFLWMPTLVEQAEEVRGGVPVGERLAVESVSPNPGFASQVIT